MSTSEHQRRAENTPVRCAVVTVSDTRTEATDASGALLRARFEAAGHPVVHYLIVSDDVDAIRAAILDAGRVAEVVVTTGGTGVAGRDATVQVAESLIGKPMPGFGELFRALSFAEIGAAAMLSRATAGVFVLADGTPRLLFCLPGSRHAVALAADRLIVPDLRHLVWETLRQG